MLDRITFIKETHNEFKMFSKKSNSQINKYDYIKTQTNQNK